MWAWRPLPPWVWAWEAPQAKPLNFPPWCGPGASQARPLNFPPWCGPGDLQGMLGYHPPWETVEGHRTQNHSYCSILYTPISIPYKAYTGALWYWRWKCWGAAGSHKSKHLEYTAYFWKGNINNLAHFSWVITLSPPDLCFYPTGGLYKPCFCSNPWCIQV